MAGSIVCATEIVVTGIFTDWRKILIGEVYVRCLFDILTAKSSPLIYHLTKQAQLFSSM